MRGTIPQKEVWLRVNVDIPIDKIKGLLYCDDCNYRFLTSVEAEKHAQKHNHKLRENTIAQDGGLTVDRSFVKKSFPT